MQMQRLIILCFLFTFTATAADDDPNHISINCGESAQSTALSGRKWLQDSPPQGSSTTGTVKGDLIAAIDQVPYNSARISRSQFSYSFHIAPGQKLIRIHFNPVSYHGFQSSSDLFTVEAGPFTLLANFSASITARALAVNTFIKEFCVTLQENQPLNIVFSPETNSHSKYTHAFVNGIEIISVPSTVSYCHSGDDGVRVLGKNYVIHVENTSALEMVQRQEIKWGSFSSANDRDGMLGMWANKAYNRSWRVCVDVGFRYLVRLHLCKVELKMGFVLLINNMTAFTSADMLKQRVNETNFWYENYMVMVEGHKREGKRAISICLHSPHDFLDQHGPLEGFEVFKISNPDLSLASPNPLPPREDSPSQTIQTALESLFGGKNAVATAVFTMICLAKTISRCLRKMWRFEFFKEENMTSARARQLCRRFSLAEIRSATKNFHVEFLLGKGGFGNVFKGLLDNGRDVVAIKRSKPDLNKGDHQFWTEVEILSELRHVNLVSLIGYCLEQQEMILVYEYVRNGTLADHLYKLSRKSNPFYTLSWKQRLKICIGAGRALDYLHTGHGIIHRDIKASNILLDEDFVAKVSDFGLAKIGCGWESQSQDTTNLKGTIGYIDPDYYKTHKLTKKSDTYAFGVVLLEVLCGRQAVEPWNEEYKRILTTWAIDKISKGQVDDIVASSLRGEISPDSLKTFVKVAERCLYDEPKKRPTMAHVVIKLQFALQQQEQVESLLVEENTSGKDVISRTDKSQENVNLLVPNKEKTVANDLPGNDRTVLTVNSRPTASCFNVKTVTSPSREQFNTTIINSARKSMVLRISRKFWLWEAFKKNRKPSNKTDLIDISASEPVSHRTSYIALQGNTIPNERVGGVILTVPYEEKDVTNDVSPRQGGEMIPLPNLRVFTFSELKTATGNFRYDYLLREGGFGRVYKGFINETSSGTTVIAVKRLNADNTQGYEEWQSEVNFLGRLSHPNLVKLLGYCSEDEELLLVYEFMAGGSLEDHLFRRASSVPPLPWDIRLKILIGAARGMAFLHATENQVIYRDFKTSNILLDESYHAKLSDFGVAKKGPTNGDSHLSTRIMGAHGYAAPEYISTGQLYVKSDVYGFGVVLLEMLTGLLAIDASRPSGQRCLVDWMRPLLSNRVRWKLKQVIDHRLEGTCPFKSAVQIAELASNCLQTEPRKRPSMQEVVDTLEGVASATHRPTSRRVQFMPLPKFYHKNPINA